MNTGGEMRASGLLLLVLFIPLAGCLGRSEAEIAAKKAELATKDDAVCKSYGAKPGTDIYVQCRMAQQKARDDEDNAAAAPPVIVNNTTVAPAGGPKFDAMPRHSVCSTRHVGLGQVHTYCN
jgi:hypothetical protein